MGDDEKMDQRLQLVTSARFLKAVDDWRRRQEDLPNRSEAIRRLVEIGMEACLVHDEHMKKKERLK